MSVKTLISEIHSLKNPKKIPIYQGFFKTGKGEYGEGDVFLGLTVPQTRALVKKYCLLEKGGARRAEDCCSLNDIDILLSDKYHEIRLAGVLILVYLAQKKIYSIKELADFYLKNAGLKAPLSRGELKGGSNIIKPSAPAGHLP